MGSLFKSFINSNGCTTCGPEITFLSREMDGTKPLIRYASPTCLLSLHKGSATKCYHHHDFKTLTATGFNFNLEHFFILYFFLLCFHGYWPRWFSLASSGSDHQEDHCYQVLPLAGAYPVQKRASRTAADDSSQ